MKLNVKEQVDSAISQLFKKKDHVSFSKLFVAAKNQIDNWLPGNSNNNGPIDVIDFFSGCGGMSLGFSALSQQTKVYNLKGAIDINETALRSYATNFGSPTLRKDIRELCNNEGPQTIRKAFNLPKVKDRPLVIIGCAPCQGFSAHVKRYGDKKDERNTLIGAFADIAVKMDADILIMENVPEILGKKYWQHYEEARQILAENGYAVKQTIYNCASFGVPQARLRAVIIASKQDFSLPKPVFDKKEYVTVRQSIGNLPAVKAGEVSDIDAFHRSAKHKSSTVDTIAKVPKNGGSRPVGVGPECLDKVAGFYDVYGRLSWDKPSITLTQYARNPASGRFTHPEQDRGLTIREAARLQSFPDSYLFQGSLDNAFKQIGESVPPLLSLAVALQIMIELSSLSHREEPLQSIIKPISSSYSTANSYHAVV
jgi:DNA (cytosine-5)-methyltransferase 1